MPSALPLRPPACPGREPKMINQFLHHQNNNHSSGNVMHWHGRLPESRSSDAARSVGAGVTVRSASRVPAFHLPGQPPLCTVTAVTTVLSLELYCKMPMSRPPDKNVKDVYLCLEQAENYESWLCAAEQFDRIEHPKWISDPQSSFFDTNLIQGRIEEMRILLAEDDVEKIVFWLRSGLARNFGGVNNPNLYGIAKSGSKRVIQQHNALLMDLFRRVCDCPENSIYDSLAFFAESRHALGKTALLLSWGFNNTASQAYHLGVIKALHEQQLLPRVISGRSVGAVVVAVVATRTAPELDTLFAQLSSEWGGEKPQSRRSIDLTAFHNPATDTWSCSQLWRWLRTGYSTDIAHLRAAVQQNVGDLTFLEAYRRTGLAANILVPSGDHHEHPRLLNHLDSPDVLLWSAALASCAFPGVCPPSPLLAKSGGKVVPYSPCVFHTAPAVGRSMSRLNLPFSHLKVLFNVNYLIVSLANPHAIPFVNPHPSPDALGRVAQAFRTLLGIAFAHYAQLLIRLRLAPSVLAHFTNQLYSGDVTLAAPCRLDVLSSLCGIARSGDEARFGIMAQRITWAQVGEKPNERSTESGGLTSPTDWQVPKIRGSCELEVLLAECMRKLHGRARRDGQAALPAEAESLRAMVAGVAHAPSLQEPESALNDGLALSSHGTASSAGSSPREKSTALSSGRVGWPHLACAQSPAPSAPPAGGSPARTTRPPLSARTKAAEARAAKLVCTLKRLPGASYQDWLARAKELDQVRHAVLSTTMQLLC